MTKLPDTPRPRFFLAVPTMLAGRHVIRLPRCANCFDEVHDFHGGAAHCCPIAGQYRAMDDEVRARWNAAEATDQQTRQLEN
jgi:hypothetical protein